MQKITLSRKKLAAALLFAATKDVRYYLNGVYVECYAARTIIVATDGHCLAAQNDQPDTVNEMSGEHSVSVIIPDHICAQFKPNARTLYDMLTLTVDGENCSLSDGVATVSFKPVDGRFPDFRRVIPDQVSGEIAQFDSELLARFGKARKILDPKRKSVYGLTIGHNGTGSATVEWGDSDFRGVIMPCRMDEPTSRPAWIDAPRAPETVAETEETAETAAPDTAAPGAVETAEPAASSTSAEPAAAPGAIDPFRKAGALYSCVSTPAGWQTRDNRTGQFIGPAFNNCTQLWNWQAENRGLMPEYDGATDIVHADETAAPEMNYAMNCTDSLSGQKGYFGFNTDEYMSADSPLQFKARTPIFADLESLFDWAKQSGVKLFCKPVVWVEPAASSTSAEPAPPVLMPARAAVEMWQASGARTETRLRYLVEHYATFYNLADQVDALYDQARGIIPAYQFEETAA